MDPGDIERALAIQEKSRASLQRDESRLFGMILCDLNLITPTDTYCVLEKYGKLITIQEYLIQQQILSRLVVEKAQKVAHRRNISFMSLLLEDRIIPKTLLQQIAFDLFHISFRSISDIIFDADTRQELSLIIQKREARVHKVIPLIIKGKTLVCGMTDPDNLIFLRDLNAQFPQYRFNPLFIPFSGFTWFYKMLYDEAWTPKTTIDKTINTTIDKPVDLSLLLKFCVTITEPAREKQAILSLYKRYALVRSLVGCPIQGDRFGMFQAFVAEYHGKITREYQCQAIEFSLKKDSAKKDSAQLLIMASPKKQVN